MKTEFPVYVFEPKELQEFIKASQKSLSCPMGYITCSLLSLLSIIIGNTVKVRIKPGWEEMVNLWICLVGDPGTHKTPAINTVLGPLFSIQREQVEVDDDGKEHVARQLFTTDATSEALRDLLFQNPHGILEVVDELAGQVKGYNQYKGGKGSDKEKRLSYWSGVGDLTNRQATAQYTPTVFYSSLSGIQPDVLGSLRNIMINGFVDRILFSNDDNPEYVYDEIGIPEQINKAYRSFIRNLFDIQDGEDLILEFSDEAKVVWKDWIVKHTAELQDPLHPKHLKGAWSKFRAYCPRIAGILEITNSYGESRTISADTLKKSISLIDYFKAQAREAFMSMHSTNFDKHIDVVVSWIHSKVSSGYFKWKGNYCVLNSSDLYNNRVNGIKTSAEAKDVLQQMADRKLGRLEEKKMRNGQFRYTLLLSPKYFK